MSGSEVALKDCYFYLLYKRKGDTTTQIPILLEKTYDSTTDTISASFEPTSYFTEKEGGLDIQVIACSTSQDFVTEDVDIDDVALWSTANAQISIAKSQLKNSQTIVAEDVFTQGIAKMSAYLDSAEEEADDAEQFATDAEDARDKAEAWAESDTAVELGKYSAKHHAEDSASKASLSRQYAEGKKLDGTDVTSGEAGYHNNAKFYAGQADDSADLAEDWATKTNGTVGDTDEHSAKYNALLAKAWASEFDDEDPSDTDPVEDDNYSAKKYAYDANVSEAEATEQALKSEGYAVGKQSGSDVGSSSPYYHNNAKYYNTQAGTAKSDAEDSRDEAKDWANKAHGTVVKDSEYSAKHYATEASSSADDAKDWAEKDTAVETGKYSAKYHATEAEASASLSRQYAEGKKLDGTDVTSGEAGYQDNAKYYAEQAASEVADIISGSTIVKKSYEDEDGNNIKSTYATKTELADLKVTVDSNTTRIENLENEAIMSFEKIQLYVRAGILNNYMSIGDEIEVEKETGLTVSTTGSLTVTVDEPTWVSHVEHLHHGVYEFVYDGTGWVEKEFGPNVNMTYLGISITGTPVDGDTISITVSTNTLVFQLVDIDHMTPKNTNLTHTATFQLKNIYRNMQFMSAEAIIYASSAMPAGTYHFNLYKNTYVYYLNSALQNKDVQFTTTVDIPAGGQLVLTTGSFNDSTSVDALKLTSYGSNGSTTALESGIICSEGTSGTDLGRANDASNNTKVNSTDRCVYGSNNWEYCGLRQWLNTDLASGWSVAKGPFSRPYSGASVQGWMYGIEKDFLDVLQEVETPCVQNWFDGGAKKVTYDKFFIPSNSQVYFTASGQEGDNWDYYKIFSDIPSPGTGADSNRIKKLNGTATYWWTRTPDPSYSIVESICSPTGTRDYTNAYNSLGVAPACVIA